MLWNCPADFHDVETQRKLEHVEHGFEGAKRWVDNMATPHTELKAIPSTNKTKGPRIDDFQLTKAWESGGLSSWRLPFFLSTQVLMPFLRYPTDTLSDPFQSKGFPLLGVATTRISRQNANARHSRPGRTWGKPRSGRPLPHKP